MIQSWMAKGLDWLKKRRTQAGVGAEATGEETGEVKVKEAKAEAMIEDKKKQKGKGQKLQMRKVEADQMIEGKKT